MKGSAREALTIKMELLEDPSAASLHQDGDLGSADEERSDDEDDCESLFTSSPSSSRSSNVIPIDEEADDDSRQLQVDREGDCYSLQPPTDGIPGLHFLSDLLPTDLETRLLTLLQTRYLPPESLCIDGGGSNQCMLFGRATLQQPMDGPSDNGVETKWKTGLPMWADELVEEELAALLAGRIDDSLMDLLFPERQKEQSASTVSSEVDSSCPLARQLILNHYIPPQGIASHIDLPHRFADGILLLSLGSGIGMKFRRSGDEHRLYLPRRSVLILSGEARWEWEHGIDEAYGDWVLDTGHQGGSSVRSRFVPRQARTSITIRFLKEGAMTVGG